MKAVKSLIIVILILFLFLSCSQGNEDPVVAKSLHVESNVSVSRSISMDDFRSGLHGVRFEFHRGNITTPIGKRIDDPDLFYIEYDGTNNDVNCTFYIPEVVKQTYLTGSGDVEIDGNAYIWYLSQYLEESIEEMRNGWENALSALLERLGQSLPYPNKDDMNERWKTFEEKGMEDFILVCSDGWGPSHTGNPMNSFFFYEKGGKQYLHFPCYISQVYSAGGGKISPNNDSRYPSLYDIDPQAFLWYASKYYHKSASDLLSMYRNDTLSAFVDEMNDAYSYSQVEPSDVYLESKTAVLDNLDDFDDDDLLCYFNVACYKPGCLVDQDGMLLTDNDRCYVLVQTDRFGDTDLFLLVPYEFHLVYSDAVEDMPNKWECYGIELWNFLETELGVTGAELDDLMDTCMVPARLYKQLLAYRMP